jgi:hypothetical protein
MQGDGSIPASHRKIVIDDNTDFVDIRYWLKHGIENDSKLGPIRQLRKVAQVSVSLMCDGLEGYISATDVICSEHGLYRTLELIGTGLRIPHALSVPLRHSRSASSFLLFVS